ncbi:Nn.00g060820.m01.CDS01 [Neocucurbitaria sp. VM-36]
MKTWTFLSTIFMVAAALAAPATTPESSVEIEARQNGVPAGPCERCDNFYKDCLHQCWWIDPPCITGCKCQTSQAFDGYCRASCGWKRC